MCLLAPSVGGCFTKLGEIGEFGEGCGFQALL